MAQNGNDLPLGLRVDNIPGWAISRHQPRRNPSKGKGRNTADHPHTFIYPAEASKDTVEAGGTNPDGVDHAETKAHIAKGAEGTNR